jgi:hypothetical protein
VGAFLFINIKTINMNSKVAVTADKNGNIISVSENNPEYGWIVVKQEVSQLENGWVKRTSRTARINGKVDELLQLGFKDGTELPGKIVVLESLTPFNQENPDRDLKIAGTTGVICRVDDQPIYRKTVYTSNVNSFDELIIHNNSDEIREVNEAQKSMNAIKELVAKKQEAANLDA